MHHYHVVLCHDYSVAKSVAQIRMHSYNRRHERATSDVSRSWSQILPRPTPAARSALLYSFRIAVKLPGPYHWLANLPVSGRRNGFRCDRAPIR
jgi:hypothetical protein